MIEKILSHFGYYKLNKLYVGGHCGCCEKAMPKTIFTDKNWRWGICEDCKSK